MLGTVEGLVIYERKYSSLRVAFALMGFGFVAPDVVDAMPAPHGMPLAEPPQFFSLAAGKKLFHGVGAVTGVDAGSGVVTIDHKAIPGLMDAMEMDYNASPKSLLAGIRKGDRVEFEVDGASYTITAIKKRAGDGSSFDQLDVISAGGRHARRVPGG